MKSPRILAIDIETAPHTAHVWGLYNQNVGLNQLMDTGRVLCLSWKWLGKGEKIGFISERAGRGLMLDAAHALLDEADIVLTYNGKKFDIPTLNKEFLERGYGPPAPYKQVDLYRTARSQFRFASNKMDHLAKELGVKTKIRHSGHSLWVQCMEGEEKAWAKMERYNKRDVLILEQLYYKMLPWIKGHPNVTIFSDPDVTETEGKTRPSCTQCGSSKVQKRGLAYARTQTYTRYHCTSCGSWSRSAVLVPRRVPLQLVPDV